MAGLLLGCVAMPDVAVAYPSDAPPQTVSSSAAVAPVPPAGDTPEASLPEDTATPATPAAPQTPPTDALDALPQTPATPSAPAVTAALPPGSGVLDSATVQRIVDRLLALHFLASAADAQDAEALAQAIRDFQSSIGISASGTLDRDTVGRLTAS